MIIQIKLLVTGGAGFIGSNLCDFLVKNSHDVVVIDNLSTGKISNLSNVINDIEFINEDIEDFDFDNISDVDVVIHLAAQPSVPLSISNFKTSSTSNLLGTINVIDFCSNHKIPLIYASSSAIYGGLEFGDDNNSEIDILSPYAADKYCMELYAKTANKLYQLSSIGLRFFNVYGPRQDPGSPYSGVISIFIDRLLDKKSVYINGGYQTRDFIYVDDIIEIIYKAVITAKQNVECEQINVLTGNSISVDLLLDILAEKIGHDVQKIYQDLPNGDPEESNGSTGKMETILSVNLTELVQLDDGLASTIDFIKNE
jgi:nucleoside-diphosphate-sugar epimerase